LAESKFVADKIVGALSMVSTKIGYPKALANIDLVEDENHCEFVYLRNFLTRTHLQDLIETTSQIHYESFRAKQLLALKESSHVGQSSRPISPSGDREASRNSQRMTMNGY
jgi:septin 3/9/12